MIYYISGPMTGILPDLNRLAFARAAGYLYDKGHIPITPFDVNSSGGGPDTYRKQLKRDLVAICGKADAIYMLSGWECSPGARAEHAVGIALNLKIVYEENV